MSKLWQKDYDLNKEVEAFEIGDDRFLDNRLIGADILGSIAQAVMLERLGVLDAEELGALKGALRQLLREEREGSLRLGQGDEDVHTLVENELVARVGEAGKKIHTGRSRNDQVALGLRLFGKEQLLAVRREALAMCQALAAFAQRHEFVPMPGYTHMQRGMLSSVGLWAMAFVESLLDDDRLLAAVYVLNDQSPLGSAAGYGVPLEVDRQLTADLLGFGRVQRNVLYCQNARGKVELAIVQALGQVGLDLSRLASDILLFTTAEYGFFEVAAELCTGSSIMPQKKNVDAMELVRGRAAAFLAYQTQIQAALAGLPSGYNRDVQDTKRPFIEALDLAQACLRISRLTVENVSVREDRLRAALTPDLYATDHALKLVAKGLPFREAYREVARNLAEYGAMEPEEALRARRHLGASGNLGIEEIQEEIQRRTSEVEEQARDFEERLAALLA